MANTVALKNGTGAIPAVGMGLWKIPESECPDAVYTAIKKGYRHFDSACDYGNEKGTGKGFKKAIDEGLVKREDLWITSKLWNTYHRPEHVRKALERTLADLGVESLDLYLIHFPIALKYVPFEDAYPPEWVSCNEEGIPAMVPDNGVTLAETWAAMEEIKAAGLAKNIGISNFNVSLIRQLLVKATVRPAVLQVELHPYLTQEKLLRYCEQEGIAVTGFSPLGSNSYVELGGAAESDSVLNTQVVKSIAEKLGKSPGQVVLRWGVQRGTSIIPKTTKEARLVENISLFDFEIPEEDMKAISGLNANRRFNDPGVFCEAAFGCYFPIYE